MKRKDLVKYLQKCDCVLFREGAKHPVYINEVDRKISTIPRHNEINNFLAKKICNDLGVEVIKKK